MSDGSLLEKLIEVSKIDGALARINAEKKKIEKELAARQLAFQSVERNLGDRNKLLEVKKSRYASDSRRIKEEREKLVERRRALSQYTDYKLQQKAEREIDHASREINSFEEGMVALLDQIESAEEELKTLKEDIDQKKKSFEEYQKESEETFKTLNEREQDSINKREELLKGVEPAALREYEGARKRYPGDAVVSLMNGDTCKGCFMHLGPQTQVMIQRDDQLVKCRGCARILYIETQEDSEEGE